MPTARTTREWQAADEATVQRALANATAAHASWNAMPAASRAAILEHAADRLEARTAEFIAMCTREAGKTIPDGVAEVRFLPLGVGQHTVLQDLQ